MVYFIIICLIIGLLYCLYEINRLEKFVYYQDEWIVKASKDLTVFGLSFAAFMETLSKEKMEEIQTIYDRKLKELENKKEG